MGKHKPPNWQGGHESLPNWKLVRDVQKQERLNREEVRTQGEAVKPAQLYRKSRASLSTGRSCRKGLIRDYNPLPPMWVTLTDLLFSLALTTDWNVDILSQTISLHGKIKSGQWEEGLRIIYPDNLKEIQV